MPTTVISSHSNSFGQPVIVAIHCLSEILGILCWIQCEKTSLFYQADETDTDSSLFDHMEGLQRLGDGSGACVDDVTKKPGLE